MNNNYYPFINTPLPYPYSALLPYIDEKTMYLHHDRHLQTYINNLNDILAKNPSLQKLSLEQLIHISPRLPANIQASVRNNAGGVYNHRFFFNSLINSDIKNPTGSLSQAIDRYFGGFDKFRNRFKEAALSVFGSGYAWLVSNNGKLSIITTANQNSPIEYNLCPVLAIDVWEHAYYLKHYNERTKYIDDWFNVVNWAQLQKNFTECSLKE